MRHATPKRTPVPGVGARDLARTTSRFSTCPLSIITATPLTLALAWLVRGDRDAIHRYLLASLQEADADDERAQEFAMCFPRGDLRDAEPANRQFRDFLKRDDYDYCGLSV
jgi:hypothetical protein